MAFLHHEFEQPISAFIKSEFLHNMDEQYKGQLVPCQLFGVSSYKGEAPTFRTFFIDKDQKDNALNGSIYDYIPPHAIQMHAEGSIADALDFGDLVYHNCMDYSFIIYSVSFLHKKREKELAAQCYFPKRNIWLAGKYLFSMEWHRMNDLLHVVALENGQVGFLPSHKIKFQNGSRSFPTFRKTYSVWKV